jgi:hypothetical protein
MRLTLCAKTFAVVRLYDVLYTKGKTLAMNTRPLRPDEDELLKATKDFVVFPVLVPTEALGSG